MADDNGSSVSGLGWFLAGLGMGALIGVLYAPKSGAETRSDILAAGLDARDKAQQLAQRGREQFNDYAQRGAEQVNDYVDRGREYYERGRTQWSQYVDKGKSMIQEQQAKVSAAVDAGKEAYINTTAGDEPQQS
jgi:gas vesicle protein